MRVWSAVVVTALVVGTGTLPAAAGSGEPAPAGPTNVAEPSGDGQVAVLQVSLDIQGDPNGREPAEPSPGDPPAGETSVDPLSEPVVAEPDRAPDGRVETPSIDASQVETLGVTWPDGASVGGLNPQIRLRTDGQWSDWREMESDAAPDATTIDGLRTRGGTDSVWVGDADAVQLSFQGGPKGGPDDVRLALVGQSDALASPGASPESAVSDAAGVRPAAHVVGSRTTMAAVTLPAAPSTVAAPAVISRAEWGAREPACQPDIAGTLVGAVVHHTAGSNNYATVQDAMQQIRNDQAYHIDGRGWCDIGYNFIVDKWGNIYEGRAGSLTQPVIGVHAGGFNTGTVGVSMLGTFSTVSPPLAALDSVAKIIGYRLGAYGRNPAGVMTYTTPGGQNSSVSPGSTVSLPVVFGHRDVAYTACPGDLGYAQLGWIRTRAQRVAYAGPLVQSLYGALLHRGPDPEGLVNWSAALLAGTPASAVGDLIAHSFEYVQTQVADGYSEILGRGPDPIGLADWTAAIMSGAMTVDDLRGRLLSSDEYYARAGGTPEAFVAALYSDALHRGPSPSEVASWVAVAQSTGRGAVAQGVWYSLESARQRVDETYHVLLGRSADLTGLATWGPYWQGHGSDGLRTQIVGSDEFLYRAALLYW